MKKIIATIMSIIVCISLVVFANAEEEIYSYTGEGFEITTTYDLNQNVAESNDGESFLYTFTSDKFENLEIKITVSKNENGYAFIHNMYNDSEENAILYTISGRDAVKFNYDYTKYIYTYSDEYVFTVQYTAYDEAEITAVNEIINGIEITAVASAPSQEDIEKIDPVDNKTDDNADSSDNTVIIIIGIAVVVVIAVIVIVLFTKKKK